jgi:hypothetical protein
VSRKKLGKPIKEAKGKYFESLVDLRNWLVVLFEEDYIESSSISSSIAVGRFICMKLYYHLDAPRLRK